MIKKLLLNLFFVSFISLFSLTNTALAEEERNTDPNDIERSIYSFQAYVGDKWYFDAIDTPNSSSSGANVTIAILDTGVTKTSQLACHNFVNEYDAFWNISGAGSGRDIASHGTLVAHTIADCDIGIAKSVNIMPVRIFTDAYASYGYPTYTDDLAVAMGIIWAVDHGADIINMSFGASCFTTWDGGCRGETGSFAGYVDTAIKYAYDRGVLLIAASGNDALPWVSYPANNPYVWAIGAVNSSLNKASFSNFGSALNFVAPGENIGTALGSVSGTSFSSPEVAAAAAVLKGSMPGLTVKEIEDAFVCTIVDLGDKGWDPQFGWGMIQIEASLELLAAGLLQTPWFPTPQLTLVSEGSGKIKAMWQSADDCNGIESYSVFLDGKFENKVENLYNDKKNESYLTVLDSGTYNVSLLATNVFDNSTELITSSITIDLTPPKFDSTFVSISTDQGVYIEWENAIDVNGIEKYQVQLVDAKNLVLKEGFSSTNEILFNTQNLIAGSYKVKIFAYDVYNNKSLPISKEFNITENSVEEGQEATTTTTIPGSSNTTNDSSTSTTTSSTTTKLSYRTWLSRQGICLIQQTIRVRVR